MKKKEVSAKYEEAWANFKQGKLEEAEACFAEVIPHVKAESWRASDLYHEYALVLRGLKKFGDAERYERMALNVALEHNEVTSVVVTFARFTLGETLFCQNRFSEALEEIGRSIGIGAKQEWLLHFLKAKVLLKQQREEEFVACCSALMELAPEGKLGSIEQIRERIEQEECS